MKAEECIVCNKHTLPHNLLEAILHCHVQLCNFDSQD